MSTETQNNTPMSAEPTDDEIINIAVEPLGIDCDRMPYSIVVFARALLSRYSSAPVAAQPDVTQKTLDDVMAGIPARDAEIEALRKEIETLRAQQPVSGADGLPTVKPHGVAALSISGDNLKMSGWHIDCGGIEHRAVDYVYAAALYLVKNIEERRASLAQPQPFRNAGELPEDDGIKPIEDVLADILKLAEEYEVKVESEWGSARSLKQIEEDGDLPIAIANARAALAQQHDDKRSVKLAPDMEEKNQGDLAIHLLKRNGPLQRYISEWRDKERQSIAKIINQPARDLPSSYITWYRSIPLEIRSAFTGVEINLSELAFYAGALAYVGEEHKEKK